MTSTPTLIACVAFSVMAGLHAFAREDVPITISPNGRGGVEIRWESSRERLYRVLSTSDFLSGEWEGLFVSEIPWGVFRFGAPDRLLGVGTTASMASLGSHFYRVESYPEIPLPADNAYDGGDFYLQRNGDEVEEVHVLRRIDMVRLMRNLVLTKKTFVTTSGVRLNLDGDTPGILVIDVFESDPYETIESVLTDMNVQGGPGSVFPVYFDSELGDRILYMNTLAVETESIETIEELASLLEDFPIVGIRKNEGIDRSFSVTPHHEFEPFNLSREIFAIAGIEGALPSLFAHPSPSDWIQPFWTLPVSDYYQIRSSEFFEVPGLLPPPGQWIQP